MIRALLLLALAGCSQTLLCWTERGYVVKTSGMSTGPFGARYEEHAEYCVVSRYRSWRLR